MSCIFERGTCVCLSESSPCALRQPVFGTRISAPLGALWDRLFSTHLSNTRECCRIVLSAIEKCLIVCEDSRQRAA